MALVTLGFGIAQPAQAAPNFKEPWTCGEAWYSHTYDSTTLSDGRVVDHGNAIDFNRTWVSDENEGDPVLASAAGDATVMYDQGGFGHYVVIDHGDGWTTLYAHLREAPTLVDQDPAAPGVQVDQGDEIGHVGKSGATVSSTTADGKFAHLHYEQRRNGVDEPITFNGQAPDVGRTHGPSDPQVESTNCPVSSDISAALIIDSSGSMSWNDPQNQRRDAARAYVTVSGQADEVGVVDFDSNPTILTEAVPVGTNRATLNSLIDGIGAGGGTNLGLALQAGCELLGRANGENRVAFFLTDGRGSYSDQASCFVQRGWKVFTIGLGSSVDGPLLQRIADETGGEYLPLADANDLVCEFQQFRELALGNARRSCEPTGSVLQGETVQLQPTILGPGLQQATFSNTFGGTAPLQGTIDGGVLQPASFASLQSASDLRMTLTSPSGREIDRDTVADDVIVDVGASSELITILQPEPGAWDVSILGVATDPSGTVFNFSIFEIASEDPGDSDPDTDEPESEDNGPSTGIDRPQRPTSPQPTPEPEEDDTDVLGETEVQCPEFNDVLEGNVHYGHICELTSEAIMLGFPSGDFGPALTVTRGQVASVLARTIGLDPVELDEPTFTDIASNAHRGNIEALFQQGLIRGYSDGTFGPNDPVRRDQVASIIAAWLELQPVQGDTFEDISADNPHGPQIYALVEAGIARGTTTTSYEPHTQLQRGQFASLVNQAR